MSMKAGMMAILSQEWITGQRLKYSRSENRHIAIKSMYVFEFGFNQAHLLRGGCIPSILNISSLQFTIHKPSARPNITVHLERHRKIIPVPGDAPLIVTLYCLYAPAGRGCSRFRIWAVSEKSLPSSATRFGSMPAYANKTKPESLISKQEGAGKLIF